jgi:hypothetical protein
VRPNFLDPLIKDRIIVRGCIELTPHYETEVHLSILSSFPDPYTQEKGKGVGLLNYRHREPISLCDHLSSKALTIRPAGSNGSQIMDLLVTTPNSWADAHPLWDCPELVVITERDSEGERVIEESCSKSIEHLAMLQAEIAREYEKLLRQDELKKAFLRTLFQRLQDFRREISVS